MSSPHEQYYDEDRRRWNLDEVTADEGVRICTYCGNADGVLVYPSDKVICRSCDDDEFHADPAGDTWGSQGTPRWAKRLEGDK